MRISDWSSDVCSSDLGEDVVGADVVAEVEGAVLAAGAAARAGLVAVEAALPRRLLSAGVDLAAVEALTLLGIAQDAVSLGDLLELLLDGLVARVDVRVQLLGQLAVGALDLVFRGRAVDVQQLRSEEHTSELQSLMRTSYTA